MNDKSLEDLAVIPRGEPRQVGLPHEGETRKLAAIMFTDMVGFSRLMHQDETKGLRLLDESNETISNAVAQHRGRVLKKMGDAILAEFSSAKSAVECAVQIQTRLRDTNADKPSDARVVLRIGIHLGDVVIRDQDLFGDGINVAARLEPLSEPGGICLSEAVYQAVAASSAIKAILVGEVELKNILQRQVIYRIPSFYPVPMSDPTDVAKSRSLHLGAVVRVEALPPPRRGFASMLLACAILLPLSGVGGMFVGVAIGRGEPYRIWEWELAEPEVLVVALQERTNPAHARVWETLDRDARDAVTEFNNGRTEEGTADRTFRRVRRALNTLIHAERPAFDESLASQFVGQAALDTADMAQFNRGLLEAAFPGTIQRYVGEPSIPFLLSKAMSDLWSTWLLAGLWVVVIVAAVFASAYLVTLKTLRIYFNDIRDVDELLDYYIRELGFNAPQSNGRELVFRATLWTTLVYNVLQLRAHVSGSTVVLTGPAPMMRRLTRRMLLLAESVPQEAAG